MVAMAINGGRQTMEMTCASRAPLLGAVRATAAQSCVPGEWRHAHPAVDGLAHVIDGKGARRPPPRGPPSPRPYGLRCAEAWIWRRRPPHPN